MLVYFWDPNDLRNCWEKDWLSELFPGHQHVICNSPREEFEDGTVFVINRHTMQYKSVWQRNKHFLVHLSDEWLSDDTEFYWHPNCLHVFRNYIKPELRGSSSVTNLPLGYKTGLVLGGEWSCADRRLIWSFVGCTRKSNRARILQSISHIKPSICHQVAGWNTPDCLDVDRYRQILVATWVVPCITGNASIDTFRLYEALECGCIPIVIKTNSAYDKSGTDYYKYLFGDDHPIPTVVDMERDLAREIADLQPNLAQRRMEISKWYQDYKRVLIARIAEICAPTRL